jgi:hypothetical protein
MGHAVTQAGQGVRIAHDGRSSPADALAGRKFSVDGAPPPSGAGLATDFLAFDRATMEKAIDHFLDQFEGLASELAPCDMPTHVLTAATAVGMSAIASGLVLRQQRIRRQVTVFLAGANEIGGADLVELPNSWSLVLTET